MNILQNDNLIVESKSFGAELTRIYSKQNNKDILWCGDEKYWGRRSPILFPIVGRLKENKTLIEDNIYSMGQHGFARDMDFKVIETSKDYVVYLLTSNDNTKKFYPYDFNLSIKYTLIDNSIRIDWIVENTDSRDIYFSIGAHPAFNIPTSKHKSINDYYLKFNYKDKVNKINLNGPFHDESFEVENLDKLQLSPELFINDALIYTDIDSISIFNNEDKEEINVEFSEFPLVGIWSPYYSEDNTIAPFICIEPWYGLCDNINSDNVYKNKSYINKLSVGKSFKASYTITVY